jgi:hypothetical protein
MSLRHAPRDAIRSARRWIDCRVAFSRLKHLPPVRPLTIAPGASIAVVGNGPIGPGLGSAIDGHDIVLRFNDCCSHGAGGYRTDIVVISNASRPLAYDKNGTMKRECIEAARLFWLAIPPSVAWRDHTDDILHRYVGLRPWRHFSTAVWSDAMTAIRNAGAPDDCIPSTGLLALCHLRCNHPSANPTLFGFSHSGTPRHAWGAERSIVEGWSDWLKRGHEPSFPHLQLQHQRQAIP